MGNKIKCAACGEKEKVVRGLENALVETEKRMVEFEKGHYRYEKLRLSTIEQFANLIKRNIAGEDFDEMVDSSRRDKGGRRE